eukprot:349034_1
MGKQSWNRGFEYHDWKNRGVLRGWPGKKKVYVYLIQSFGDFYKGFDLWTQSPKKYLQQKPPRKAVINISLGKWRNSLDRNHKADIQRLATAIKRATQLDAIVVTGAGQDGKIFPSGVNICQDLDLLNLVGKYRNYPASWGNDQDEPQVITVAAFSYVPKNVQPTVWTHYGESCVDLWAFGVSIIVPINGNTAYTIVNVTSYASPVI